MTQESAQDKLNSKLNSVRWKVQNLQSGVQLSSLRTEVGNLDAQVKSMPNRIQDVREKGYIFSKTIEAKAKEFYGQWDKLCPQVIKQIDAQVPMLQMELSIMSAQLGQVEANAFNPSVGLSMAERFEHALSSFENKVNAAQRAISGSFEGFAGKVKELDEELDRIEWMLQQLAEACFKLLPTAAGLFAVKARWARDERMDKNDPKGVLYLTDQRLIFEQKEEVATKKILFVTTATEKVQNLLLEVPVALVEKVETSKKGLFKNEDHLTLAFRHGAPVRTAWFHLDGQDCNLWQGYINLAVAHEYDDERVKPVDEKVIDKMRSIPSKCPNCGAPMNQTLLRGQEIVTCEYCQYVVRF